MKKPLPLTTKKNSPQPWLGRLLCGASVAVALAGCGGGGGSGGATGEELPTSASGGSGSTTAAPGSAGGGGGGTQARTDPGASTPAPAPVPATTPAPLAAGAPGNPNGHCAVPAAAQAVPLTPAARVIGDGTPASCTGEAVVNAVAQGGQIRFNCGPDPVTITLSRTAKVFNDKPDVVLDGGGKVTLSGGGRVRILYQNTCDAAQVWTTDHCANQSSPSLTVQNIAFDSGNATGETVDGGGGGAIFVRGGRFKVVNSRFTRNRCDATGKDVGGAAVRALNIYNDEAVPVVSSTFGGEDDSLGNVCSNGGGLSSIGVSYTVLNSVFSHNRAIGQGGHNFGTPGGGSGGAIYNDGDFFNLQVCGTDMHDNTAVEGGGAIFYVSNDHTGWMSITDSVLARNLSAGFETSGLPGIFVLAAGGQPVVRGSSLSR